MLEYWRHDLEPSFRGGVNDVCIRTRERNRYRCSMPAWTRSRPSLCIWRRETEGSHTQPGSGNLAPANAGTSVKEVPRVFWSCIIQNQRRRYISIASDLNWHLPPNLVYLRCNSRCDFTATTTPVALVLEKYRTMRRPLKLCIGGVLSRGERASGNASLSK